MFSDLIALIKEWNHKRKARQHMLRTLKNDIPYRRILKNPGVSAHHILVIDALYGLGDAMYANGLIKALIHEGREITVATLRRTSEIYQNTRNINRIFILENINDINKCASISYDLVIDLSYVGLDRWPLRIALMKEIEAWTISCSLWATKSKAVNEVIDFSNETHMSERMAFVYKKITGKNVPTGRIYPDSGTQRSAQPKNVIYVNTIAGETDRELSDEQVTALENWFNQKRLYTGLFYRGNKTKIKETDFVKNANFSNLREALAVVAEATAVVTPDTSIVHAASSANIPVLVLFCSGELDYFKKCQMWETWAPLSKINISLRPTCNEVNPNRHGVTPVSAINPDRITEELENLLRIIKDNN